VGGYDNRFHVTTEEESFSIKLKKTPLCMEVWKDSWIIVGGKGLIWALSIEERRIIHQWQTSLGSEGKIDCNKMLMMPDFTFICACSRGQIQWHGFSSPMLALLTLEPAGDCNDFIIFDAMKKDHIEVAVATDTGLCFVKVLISVDQDYKMQQTKYVHRRSEKVKCLAFVR